MTWDKFKLEYEFFSNINPIGVILGLLIGTVLLFTLFGVFRERKVISLMYKITVTILTIVYVLIFIMLFYANNTILGKVIVTALFSLVLYLIYKNKLRHKKSRKKESFK